MVCFLLVLATVISAISWLGNGGRPGGEGGCVFLELIGILTVCQNLD